MWSGSQDPALCPMDYDPVWPGVPRRLDTPLTRVSTSGARNEGQSVGVPSPPLFLPNSDGKRRGENG